MARKLTLLALVCAFATWMAAMAVADMVNGKEVNYQIYCKWTADPNHEVPIRQSCDTEASANRQIEDIKYDYYNINGDEQAATNKPIKDSLRVQAFYVGGKPLEGWNPTKPQKPPDTITGDKKPNTPPASGKYKVRVYKEDDAQAPTAVSGTYSEQKDLDYVGGDWSSPRKVDTGLTVIPSVHTPPGRRTPATSAGAWCCRRPRCTRRSPPALRAAW